MTSGAHACWVGKNATAFASFLFLFACTSSHAVTPEGIKDSRDTLKQAHVFHILFSSHAAADAARARLVKEVPSQLFDKFRALARAESKDPGSAAQGGDLKNVREGEMVKSFDKAAFSLPPHTLSPVIQTEFGWHLIYVDAVQEQKISSICSRSLEQAIALASGEERRQLEGSNAGVTDKGFAESIQRKIGLGWSAPFKDWNGDMAFFRVEALASAPHIYRLIAHSEHVFPVLNGSPLACRRSARHEFEVNCLSRTAELRRLVEFEGRAASGVELFEFDFPPAATKQVPAKGGLTSQLVRMACKG